jgi:hypothetical protein
VNIGKIIFFTGLVLCAVMPEKMFAEEFLGEVYDQEAAPKQGKAPKPESRKKDPVDESHGSPWTFGLGLGGGMNSFSGTFRALYHINRVIVPGIALSYASIKADGFSRKDSSIETPLMLFAANPTPFWPFVGAGPGYVAWQQSDPLGTYDEKSSLVGFYLYGILLKFSEKFALLLENRTTHYVGATPAKKTVDRGLPTELITYEEDTITAFSFSFQLSF